jgi:hypothetical protein
MEAGKKNEMPAAGIEPQARANALIKGKVLNLSSFVNVSDPAMRRVRFGLELPH